MINNKRQGHQKYSFSDLLHNVFASKTQIETIWRSGYIDLAIREMKCSPKNGFKHFLFKSEKRLLTDRWKQCKDLSFFWLHLLLSLSQNLYLKKIYIYI